MRLFQAANGFYAYQLVKWGLGQTGAALGLVLGQFAVLAVVPDIAVLGFRLRALLEILEILALASYLAQIPVTFVAVHLDYRMRWYLVTDRSLRIREGTWVVREQTLTFSNIQNLVIRQGPLQRLLGIEDLEVSTAGGGGAAGGEDHGGHEAMMDMHLARFRGVVNAQEIRGAILEHLRPMKGAGLGDPDDRGGERGVAEPAGRDSAAVDAARDLLQEARALRQAVCGAGRGAPQA